MRYFHNNKNNINMDKKVMRFNEWLNENELVNQGLAGAAGEQSVEIPGAAEVPAENIEGGISSGKSIEDIANKHGVSVEDINAQLVKGVKVEMEHTDDENIAREISMDHLMEDPAYYDKLEKIEAKNGEDPADEIKGDKKTNDEE